MAGNFRGDAAGSDPPIRLEPESRWINSLEWNPFGPHRRSEVPGGRPENSEAYRGVCRWGASSETDGIRGPTGAETTGTAATGLPGSSPWKAGRCSTARRERALAADDHRPGRRQERPDGQRRARPDQHLPGLPPAAARTARPLAAQFPLAPVQGRQGRRRRQRHGRLQHVRDLADEPGDGRHGRRARLTRSSRDHADRPAPRDGSAPPDARSVGRSTSRVHGFRRLPPNNEAERSLNADVARTSLRGRRHRRHGRRPLRLRQPVPGAGSPTPSGPATCRATSNVLQDGPAGSTDEGRAMLENIHDIAPGAGSRSPPARRRPARFRRTTSDASRRRRRERHRRRPRLLRPSRSSRTASSPRPSTTSSGTSGHLPLQRGGQLRANQGATSRTSAARRHRQRSLGAGRIMNFDAGHGDHPVADHGRPMASARPRSSSSSTSPSSPSSRRARTADVTSDVDFYVLDSNGNIVMRLGRRQQRRHPRALQRS